jgi:predicted nucleic acid-binding protein
MSEFVLDCSAALPWVFANEATAATEALLDDLASGGHAWVPALWHLELANVMLGAQRRGQIDKAGAEKFLATLRAVDIEVDDETISVAWTRTLGLGETYGLTAYDAAYLELALRKGLPLASLDQELRNACSKAGGQLLL